MYLSIKSINITHFVRHTKEPSLIPFSLRTVWLTDWLSRQHLETSSQAPFLTCLSNPLHSSSIVLAFASVYYYWVGFQPSQLLGSPVPQAVPALHSGLERPYLWRVSGSIPKQISAHLSFRTTRWSYRCLSTSSSEPSRLSLGNHIWLNVFLAPPDSSAIPQLDTSIPASFPRRLLASFSVTEAIVRFSSTPFSAFL